VNKGVINIDPQEEIYFMDRMMRESPKNFQILEHKKMFVNMVENWEPEIRFVQMMFSDDAKNYHAWSYLIWLCQAFDLYEELKPFVETIIEKDVGNNSAWSFRYFLYNSRESKLNQENAVNQIKYTMEKIKIWEANESAWNYLKGFLKQFNVKAINYTVDNNMKIG